MLKTVAGGPLRVAGLAADWRFAPFGEGVLDDFVLVFGAELTLPAQPGLGLLVIEVGTRAEMQHEAVGGRVIKHIATRISAGPHAEALLIVDKLHDRLRAQDDDLFNRAVAFC